MEQKLPSEKIKFNSASEILAEFHETTEYMYTAECYIAQGGFWHGFTRIFGWIFGVFAIIFCAPLVVVFLYMVGDYLPEKQRTPAQRNPNAYKYPGTTKYGPTRVEPSSPAANADFETEVHPYAERAREIIVRAKEKGIYFRMMEAYKNMSLERKDHVKLVAALMETGQFPDPALENEIARLTEEDEDLRMKADATPFYAPEHEFRSAYQRMSASQIKARKDLNRTLESRGLPTRKLPSDRLPGGKRRF